MMASTLLLLLSRPRISLFLPCGNYVHDIPSTLFCVSSFCLLCLAVVVGCLSSLAYEVILSFSALLGPVIAS
ncbi:hypothetical protein Micbo1qcDRAFT_158885 [Microdochium bolleyi]|uniref:Uncharacterized protein n=1 Tax=Microdochium bolleyi TaxID=196109 RepID=A0A136J9Y5_9PEZI|nr:hypothetical protein Micbo1qcDRAFT_158885 [Microdochium bolleyi]